MLESYVCVCVRTEVWKVEGALRDALLERDAIVRVVRTP